MMKNRKIWKVPAGIYYIDEWKEFNNMFLEIPHILNKQITGCGFTDWCIKGKTCNRNIILCSPRNILLDNKEKQNPGTVYRIRSNYDTELNVDKNLGLNEDSTTPSIEQSLEAEEARKPKKVVSQIDRDNIYRRVTREYDQYVAARGILPKKILVTYDSFHVIKDILEAKGILHTFNIIVDEFQTIFTDSRFKSDTEMEFVSSLQGIERVCYLSATPMMEEYLEMIPEFRDLLYLELDWAALESTRVKKPDLEIRIVKSIFEPVKKIITSYKNGDFAKMHRNGDNGEIEVVESKEAIFYVNSVTNIIDMIRKNKLRPEEVNILCSNTDKNREFIARKLGNSFKIGTVPLYDEPRKMFTFCTRTVYLGADFFSDNARSFILSDANVECLAVDISLDLPQILGRQRLERNPWKNWAAFYYRSLIKKDEELNAVLDNVIAKKLEDTKSLLGLWDKADTVRDKLVFAEAMEDLAKIQNYKKNYIAVNRREGSMPVVVQNNLAIIAERRAYDIQKYDYRDRFTIINRINPSFEGISGEVNAFMILWDSIRNYREKLKVLCEANLSEEAKKIILTKIDIRTQQYVKILGLSKIKALNYRTTDMDRYLEDKLIINDEKLKNIIYSEFKVGDKITRKEIKEKLTKIYNDLGLDKTAKAQDIENWFELRSRSMWIEGKSSSCLEMIKRKY